MASGRERIPVVTDPRRAGVVARFDHDEVDPHGEPRERGTVGQSRTSRAVARAPLGGARVCASRTSLRRGRTPGSPASGPRRRPASRAARHRPPGCPPRSGRIADCARGRSSPRPRGLRPRSPRRRRPVAGPGFAQREPSDPATQPRRHPAARLLSADYPIEPLRSTAWMRVPSSRGPLRGPGCTNPSSCGPWHRTSRSESGFATPSTRRPANGRGAQSGARSSMLAKVARSCTRPRPTSCMSRTEDGWTSATTRRSARARRMGSAATHAGRSASRPLSPICSTLRRAGCTGLRYRVRSSRARRLPPRSTAR